MKTQNTKLNFKKDSVVELNENQLNDVNGGSSLALSLAVASSAVCVVAVSVVAVSVAIAVASEE